MNPTPDTQQPQPGPSPTPTPHPAAAIQILAMSDALPDESVILTFPEPFGQLQVSKEFMELEPEIGDYYAITDNAKWVMAQADYAARFPQS